MRDEAGVGRIIRKESEAHGEDTLTTAARLCPLFLVIKGGSESPGLSRSCYVIPEYPGFQLRPVRGSVPGASFSGTMRQLIPADSGSFPDMRPETRHGRFWARREDSGTLFMPSCRLARHMADCGASGAGTDGNTPAHHPGGFGKVAIGMAIGADRDGDQVDRAPSGIGSPFRTVQLGSTQVSRKIREYPIFRCATIIYARCSPEADSGAFNRSGFPLRGNNGLSQGLYPSFHRPLIAS